MRESVVTISTDALGRLAGTPHWPVIIDVRIDEDLEAVPHALPGSHHQPHQEIRNARAPADSPVVVVCHKGLKLSQGAAALLRCRGIAARHLEGGMVAWREAGLPTVKIQDPMSWKTQSQDGWCAPSRPGVGALAAVWLVRRFLDRDGTVMFVDADQLTTVADRFDVQPLPDDVQRFHGLASSLGIACPALDAFAGRIETVAAITEGLRAIHGEDLTLANSAMPVFDGLFQTVNGNA